MSQWNNGKEGSDLEVSTSHLDSLKVIESLEIGPVNLEDRKLSAAYRLKVGSEEDSPELRYVYDEDVFDPNEHDLPP